MTDLTTVKFTAHDLKSLTEREVIVRIPKGIVVDYSPFNDESFLSQAKTLKKKEFETKPPIKWSGKDSTAKLLTLTNGDLELWICRKRFELTLSPEGWYQTKQKEDKKSIICNSGDVSDARSNVLNERNKFQRKIKEKSKNYTNVLTRNFLETVSDDESEDTKKLLALKKVILMMNNLLLRVKPTCYNSLIVELLVVVLFSACSISSSNCATIR